MENQSEQVLAEIIGNRIKLARNEAGITQEQMGRLLGITRSSIANIERGAQRPYAHQLAAISRLTGVSADVLLHGNVARLGPVSSEPLENEPDEETAPTMTVTVTVVAHERVLSASINGPRPADDDAVGVASAIAEAAIAVGAMFHPSVHQKLNAALADDDAR